MHRTWTIHLGPHLRPPIQILDRCILYHTDAPYTCGVGIHIGHISFPTSRLRSTCNNHMNRKSGTCCMCCVWVCGCMCCVWVYVLCVGVDVCVNVVWVCSLDP